MIKFHKVSYEQYKKDILPYLVDTDEELIKEIYNSLKLPKRATKGSAGYDFYAPFDIILQANSTIAFPTGFSVEMDDDNADGERHGGFGSTTNALFPKNRT